ncbi:MAG: hypothetical protein ACR2MQ_16185 [Gemmatimonadaceae bacterium]
MRIDSSRFVAYIRSRSGEDIALATLGTALGLWLCSRLVLASGSRNSVAGVVAATAMALVLMLVWCAVSWLWITRRRRL